MKENIIVLEPFELISIISFSGIQQVNDHGRVKLSGLIQTKKKDEYIQKAARETWIKISAINEAEQKIPFFCGVLEELEIRVDGGTCILTLSAATGTRLMDFEYHTRSFQRKGITYKEVIDVCNESYLQAATIMTAGKGTELSGFYMQYRESNWEFIKRLTSSLNTIIVPSCKTEGVKYFFGIPEKKQDATFEPDIYRVEQNWEEFQFKKDNGINVGISDSMEYVVQGRDIYDLGSNVTFDGRNLCIWKIETELKGNELIHTYFLKTKAGLRIPEFHNEKLIGLTLLGKVSEVEGERIKIIMDEDENKERSGSRWFGYSTVYSSKDGTGWYCMPEEGDTIRLYFPTEVEKYSYAVNAVHENNGSGVRTDPEQKIWRNKEGKEIRLTPERILITNNDGLSVELNDQSGIQINSDKSIRLTAADNISINSANAGLEMNASNRIVLKQGDSKLIMEDGIQMEGAKVRLE